MEGHEYQARRHAAPQPRRQLHRAAPRRELHQVSLFQIQLAGIGGMDFHEGPRLAAHELRRLRRAREGVPVRVQPACRQDIGKLMIGRFAWPTMSAWQEPSPARRRRKAAIEKAPLRARVVRGRAGPLQILHRAQAGAGRTRHVARLSGSKTDEFVPDFGGRCMGEPLLAEPLGEQGNDLPVGQRVAWRIE